MKVKKISGRLLNYQSELAANNRLGIEVQQGKIKPMTPGTRLAMYVNSQAEQRFWESEYN